VSGVQTAVVSLSLGGGAVLQRVCVHGKTAPVDTCERIWMHPRQFAPVRLRHAEILNVF
jgi:hypothetical protein